MSEKCFGFLFSNEPVFSNDRFNFFISSESNEKKNQLKIAKDSNLFLIKFEYDANNTKYLIVEDKEKNVSHSCPFDSFTSHFVSYISKNGKPKGYPKNKKRFNWLNTRIDDQEIIKNILDFAFLPHKFNNFYQIAQKVAIEDSIDEFRNIIFQFRPNGYFLSIEKYFDFTIDFILFHNEKDTEILESSLFNNFVDVVINELSEMKRYIELSSITFCTKNRKIIPPLEVSHLPKSNPDKFTKLCETVIIFYDSSFLLWAFNINFNLDLFFSLFKKWKPADDFKFKVEDIYDIVALKLESKDFSNYALQKYLEFVKLYLQEDQIKDFELLASNFSESIQKQIKNLILQSNEKIQDDNKPLPRIDQKDFDDNQNKDQSPDNDDQNYIDRINELRGLWFNSIPNSFLYKRKEEKDVYSPPFTFRLFESPQNLLGGGKKNFHSSRPNHIATHSVVSNVKKNKSSRPSNRHPLIPG